MGQEPAPYFTAPPLPPVQERRTCARSTIAEAVCRDGGSRCFGFVGFRTPAEAEAAVRYFNKSYMDTLRLSVEVRCG